MLFTPFVYTEQPVEKLKVTFSSTVNIIPNPLELILENA
jgi:hypothetical protein